MSKPRLPAPVKPIVALILARPELSVAVMRRLSACLGPPDLVTDVWPFTATDYYHREMGPELGRQLASFLHLADSSRLPDWKLHTNSLEGRFSLGGRRLVNLDPGYLCRERLVLATGKDYAHRLHLRKGIFGDLTLQFSRGGVQPLSWSYPDYAQGPLPEFLLLVRRKFLWQLQRLEKGR